MPEPVLIQLEQKVIQIGNSIGVIIPAKVAQYEKIKKGDILVMEPSGRKIILRKIARTSEGDE